MNKNWLAGARRQRLEAHRKLDTLRGGSNRTAAFAEQKKLADAWDVILQPYEDIVPPEPVAEPVATQIKRPKDPDDAVWELLPELEAARAADAAGALPLDDDRHADEGLPSSPGLRASIREVLARASRGMKPREIATELRARNFAFHGATAPTLRVSTECWRMARLGKLGRAGKTYTLTKEGSRKPKTS